jgi:sulfur carrier protein ThiS
VGLTASDAKTLIVNGEPREIAAKNLAEALIALDYADAIVGAALNGEFVPAFGGHRRNRVASVRGRPSPFADWADAELRRAADPRRGG